MRLLLLAAAFAAAATAVPSYSDAQSQQQRRERERQQQGRGRGGGGENTGAEAEARRQRDREWNQSQARLPGERNAGPCPFVKVLYDAGRYVEFGEAREAASAVAWTGEIQGVAANCRYREDDPIRIDMEVLFGFGKGPRAEGDQKTYNWWVAVTERNRTVLAKEYFATQADFRGGDRAMARERLASITIPRANQNVSGSNFEVLVGFDVTPQMAEFNREGKRFRVDAGSATTARQAQTTSQ
jgi:hypothetical protein